MCEFCDKMKSHTGYKGQKYEVRYTRDGVEHVAGWQNDSEGGLENAAKLMPGVTATRIVEVNATRQP